MTIAMQPIYTQTVGAGGASSITFNNIPQTFNDLMLSVSVRTTDTSLSNYVSDCLFRLNNVASGYSSTWLRNNGGSPSTFRATGQNWGSGLAGNGRLTTVNSFANSELYLPNYISSNFKPWMTHSSTESNTANFDSTNYSVAGLWSNTAAITSIYLADGYANFAQYSTFTLYGITKG